MRGCGPTWPSARSSRIVCVSHSVRLAPQDGPGADSAGGPGRSCYPELALAVHHLGKNSPVGYALCSLLGRVSQQRVGCQPWSIRSALPASHPMCPILPNGRSCPYLLPGATGRARNGGFPWRSVRQLKGRCISRSRSVPRRLLDLELSFMPSSLGPVVGRSCCTYK